MVKAGNGGSNESKDNFRAGHIIKNSEQRLADIINFLPDATFVIDKEGRIIAWNRAIENLTGTKAQDILGKGNYEYAIPFYGFRRPILVDLVLCPDMNIEAEYNSLQIDGMNLTGEVFLPSFGKNGSYIWAKAAPLYDDSGNIIGAIESLRDITEHKRAEEALKESEAKFRLLFERSADAMFLLDGEKFIDCNKAAMDMMKCSDKEELLNIHPSQIAQERQPDGRPSHEKAGEMIRTAFLKGNHKFEWVRRRANGEEFPVEVTLTAIPWKDKQILHVILQDITEQKLAIESLRESEEKYRNLVERANYGITIVQDGTVRYANPALAKIWGGSVEDIVGRPFADFIDPSEIPNVEERYHQRMANEDATPIYETVLRSRDGNKISAELNAGLITFQGKSADLIIIQDITERKAVEERLFSLIRFQREMLDTAATWIDMFDAGGNITFWNLAAERISGYSRNEVLGHAKIWEWLYPDPEYRDKMMADVTAIILRNEHVDNFETVVRCKDSRERVILWHSNNFIDKDGKILGGIGIGADVTESINAQLAFKESKQRLSDIIDFLPDAIMVIDKDGKIISWNQAIVAMTGVKAEDILGKSDYEYAVPFYGQRRPILVDLVLKSQKGFERAYDNLEIKDGTLTGEAYIPNLRGRQAYLFGTASALYDLKGNVVGAIESIRDITEYKRAEEAIKAERDRAEQYLNIAEVILVVLDAEARITLLNRKGYQVLGYEEDELMGRDWIKTCLRPQDHEAVHEVNRKIIAGEIELFEYYESYILNKKGEEHLIAWHTTIIKDGEGCIIGTLSSGEDITQRRKAEEKNLQLAAIVESSNDAIVGGLLDGTITNWNRGAERIYGYTEDEIIGQPVTHLVSPKCLDEVPQILARLRQGEHIDHYESLSRRKDGAEFPVDLTLSLIYDTKGRMIGASSIVRDITERKRAEDELRWNAALLEAQVESSLDGILVVDGQGKRITTNQRLLTMLNVPRSTIEQENDEALLQYVVGRVKNPDQFLEKVMYLYHHQDETSRDEIEFKDGLVVDRYSSPVIGRDGKYYGRIWTFRDITERKRAEEGLKRTQSSIRIAMDLVKLVRWEYDVENDMFTFDDQFYSLYGTTAEREGGPLMSSRDYARKFIPVEDASIVAEEVSKALATTDPNFTSQLEHRIIRADGTEGVIAVRFGIIKNSEGRTIRTYGANQDITDRKLAEEALRESRQRLANIVDFLPDATFAVNREGKVIAWNRAIEEMTGVSKDDMLDRGGYAYSVPFYGEPRPILIDLVFKDQEEIKSKYSNIIRKGDQIIAENTATMLNQGKGANLWGIASPLYDSRGSIVGAIESIRDITERKQAEEALRESEERYRNLVERANDGIIVIQDGLIKYANSRSGMIWDSAVEEIVGKSFTDYVYPDEIPHMAERYRRRMANEYVEPTYETILKRKDGSKIFVELSAGLITLQGKPADLVIVRDITERKQAEEALRKSEQSYHLLAENVTDVIWTMDMNMKFVYISPSNVRMTGFSSEEMMTMPLDEVLTPSSLETVNRTIAEELENEKISRKDRFWSRTIELEENCKDGHTIWVEVKTTFVYDQEGRPIGIQGVSRDITDRKQMEKELLRSRDELEKRVIERTADLEAKNSEMERFIYTVSHDLRSPLISMSGFLGFLKADAEKGDMKRMDEDFRIVSDAVTKMDILLLDTLELSRIGRIVNPPNAVPFGEIVNEALAQSSAKMSSKIVKVTVDEDLPIVQVDRIRLVEVPGQSGRK